MILVTKELVRRSVQEVEEIESARKTQNSEHWKRVLKYYEISFHAYQAPLEQDEMSFIDLFSLHAKDVSVLTKELTELFSPLACACEDGHLDIQFHRLNKFVYFMERSLNKI